MLLCSLFLMGLPCFISAGSPVTVDINATAWRKRSTPRGDMMERTQRTTSHTHTHTQSRAVTIYDFFLFQIKIYICLFVGIFSLGLFDFLQIVLSDMRKYSVSFKMYISSWSSSETQWGRLICFLVKKQSWVFTIKKKKYIVLKPSSWTFKKVKNISKIPIYIYITLINVRGQSLPHVIGFTHDILNPTD